MAAALTSLGKAPPGSIVEKQPPVAGAFMRELIACLLSCLLALAAAGIAQSPAERRQAYARGIQEAAKQEDIELTALAGGEDNETIRIDSEMFKDAEGRRVFIRLLRTHWQKDMCSLGFKQVKLSSGGLFSGSTEYELRCPLSAKENSERAQARQKLASDIEKQLAQEGMKWRIRATGVNNTVYDVASPMVKAKSDLRLLSDMTKSRLGRQLCDHGFTMIRISSLVRPAIAARFPLACSTSQ